MICDGVELRWMDSVLQVRFYVAQAWSAWQDIPSLTTYRHGNDVL